MESLDDERQVLGQGALTVGSSDRDEARFIRVMDDFLWLFSTVSVENR